MDLSFIRLLFNFIFACYFQLHPKPSFWTLKYAWTIIQDLVGGYNYKCTWRLPSALAPLDGRNILIIRIEQVSSRHFSSPPIISDCYILWRWKISWQFSYFKLFRGNFLCPRVNSRASFKGNWSQPTYKVLFGI